MKETAKFLALYLAAYLFCRYFAEFTEAQAMTLALVTTVAFLTAAHVDQRESDEANRIGINIEPLWYFICRDFDLGPASVAVREVEVNGDATTWEQLLGATTDDDYSAWRCPVQIVQLASDLFWEPQRRFFSSGLDFVFPAPELAAPGILGPFVPYVHAKQAFGGSGGLVLRLGLVTVASIQHDNPNKTEIHLADIPMTFFEQYGVDGKLSAALSDLGWTFEGDGTAKHRYFEVSWDSI